MKLELLVIIFPLHNEGIVFWMWTTISSSVLYSRAKPEVGKVVNGIKAINRTYSSASKSLGELFCVALSRFVLRRSFVLKRTRREKKNGKFFFFAGKKSHEKAINVSKCRTIQRGPPGLRVYSTKKTRPELGAWLPGFLSVSRSRENWRGKTAEQ